MWFASASSGTRAENPMARSARELARETPALSSLPTIYARLTAALAKPRVSTAQIAEIIASDSALTARLLRLVTSAFYAFPLRTQPLHQSPFLVRSAATQALPHA